jgi:thymidylate synthase
MLKFSNFTEAYSALAKEVYENPDYVSAPRGQRVKEKLAVSFSIKDPLNRLPMLRSRGFSVSYAVAESLWYIAGLDSTEWISNYSSFWKQISDDGVTANSAYGARIFKKHSYQAHDASMAGALTQWEFVKRELKNDPDSRRAVIHIRMPQDSHHAQKDMPCTLSLQFFIRDSKLHLWVAMRSSDLILGIGNDIPAFTLMQEMMAAELSVDVGEYMHTSGSLHIYERHFKMAEEIIAERVEHKVPRMPRIPTYRDIIPIQSMLATENELRSTANPDALISVLDNFKNLVDESYWRDWMIILASHQASKLGYKDLQRDFLLSTSFSGYHFFDR